MSGRHGTIYGYNSGCRETCCRTAIATYRREHYQASTDLVDAAPVRRRINELVRAGATVSLIGELAQVPDATLYPLAHGVQRRVRPTAAAAILALTPDMFAPATPASGVAEALRLLAGGRTLADAAAGAGVKVESVIRAAERSPSLAVRRLVVDAKATARRDMAS